METTTITRQHNLFSLALRERVARFNAGTGSLTVLWDMDSVIADWEPAFVEHFRADFPHLTTLGVGERDSFNLYQGLTDEEIEATNQVMAKTGLYRTLRPVPGAVEAILEMEAAGIDIAIVTSPWIPNPTCADDKLWWNNNVIADGWADRTIITKDKTRVIGDILIDDKPDVTGALAPSWEHCYFHASYNAMRTGIPRIGTDWNWREVILGEH